MEVTTRIRRRIPSISSEMTPKSAGSASNKPILPRGYLRKRQVPVRQTTSSKAKHKPSEESDCEGQDVKFIDTPKAASSTGSTKLQAARTTQKINAEDILERSQENVFDRVYQVDLHASRIGKIENLDKFTKLRVLDLSCNYIKKIENLHNNKDLRELKLYDNNIEKIENLDQLKELCHLQLQYNTIKSIGTGLANQRKLRVLRLDGNCLYQLDVRELASCGQLTCLDISNNKLDNISAINSLTSLEELIAINNRLRSVSDLSRCKKLHEVDVSYNKLTDLSGLKMLPQLTCLHASHNLLTCLKSLGKHRCLQELNLKSNRFTDLRHIVESYPTLQILDISENHLESMEQVETLQQMPELVELYISGNPVTSEEGVKLTYHTEIQKFLPSLAVLDGAQLKKTVGKPGTPLMRPMSASSVITSHQIETQIKAIDDEMLAFEKSITDRFESLKMAMAALPKTKPQHSDTTVIKDAVDRPVSRSGKRSRIKLALDFAAQQYSNTLDTSEK